MGYRVPRTSGEFSVSREHGGGIPPPPLRESVDDGNNNVLKRPQSKSQSVTNRNRLNGYVYMYIVYRSSCWHPLILIAWWLSVRGYISKHTIWARSSFWRVAETIDLIMDYC